MSIPNQGNATLCEITHAKLMFTLVFVNKNILHSDEKYIYKYKIFMVNGTYKAEFSAFTQMMAKLLHP